jgi:hypothetical protein
LSLSLLQIEVLENLEKCWDMLSKLEEIVEEADLVNEQYSAAKIDKLVKEFDPIFETTYSQIERLFGVTEND